MSFKNLGGGVGLNIFLVAMTSFGLVIQFCGTCLNHGFEEGSMLLFFQNDVGAS